ncbi:hypothetical protein AB1Y20_010765 [Prymnesium parvum]|uniref:Inosine/uridine-preferring nucleoside hydrolase domain-containing protein n=1 Tax=Prymnesium parvum TaxID=97485 RepID=A0AB34IS90_PRYPA
MMAGSFLWAGVLAAAPPLASLRRASEAARLERERAERAQFERERAQRPQQPTATGSLPPRAPVQLLIDTDLGFDVDDVGALAVAHHLQDIGACQLLAVVHNTGFFKGIGGVDVVNQHYGRGSATSPLLGAYTGGWGGGASAQAAQDSYTSTLEAKYHPPVRSAAQVPSALLALTAALAAADDHSVVVASIGELTNLRELLRANASLVERKVRRVVFMDGSYNFGCGDAHGSGVSPWLGPTAACDGAAMYVTRHLPRSVRQIYTLNGGEVLTGGRFNDGCGMGPVKDAYQIWTGGGSRPSWDLIAVYLAVMGTDSLYSSERPGTESVDVAGNEKFDATNTTTNAAQVWIDSRHNGDVVRMLDDILCSSPCGAAAPAVAGCAGYKLHSGHNCWGSGHGAVDLESPPRSSCGTMPLADCQKKCDQTQGCDGVTVVAQQGGLVACYRKANITLSQCDYGNAWSFDTWTKLSEHVIESAE